MSNLELVVKYLMTRPSKKFTTEEICLGVNDKFGTTFTTHYVSKMIPVLKSRKVLKYHDCDGSNTRGMSVYRWTYVPMNKRK